MKLEISLENIYADNEWNERIGTIIRDEISNAVRSEIRKIVKEQQKELAAKVTAAVRESIKQMSVKQIQNISYKMLGG
jgi:hypothetical protein